MAEFKIGDRVAVRDGQATLIGRIFDEHDAAFAKRIGGRRWLVCSDSIYRGPKVRPDLENERGPYFVGDFAARQMTLIPEVQATTPVTLFSGTREAGHG